MEQITYYVFSIMLVVRFTIELRDKKSRISKLGKLNYEMASILGYRVSFFVYPIFISAIVVFSPDFNSNFDYINTVILLIFNCTLTYLIYKYITQKNSIYAGGIAFIETAIAWDDVLSYEFEEVEHKSFLQQNKTIIYLVFHTCYKYQRTRKEKDIRFIIPSNQINSVSNFMEMIKLDH